MQAGAGPLPYLHGEETRCRPRRGTGVLREAGQGGPPGENARYRPAGVGLPRPHGKAARADTV